MRSQEWGWTYPNTGNDLKAIAKPVSPTTPRPTASPKHQYTARQIPEAAV